MKIECLARRIHSPFQGLLQLVRVPFGEAESVDGVRWVLYVSHDAIVSHTGLSEVRFGDWTAADGLHRAVVRGTGGSAIVEDIGAALVWALEERAAGVPFAPQDHYEYWLLDAEGQPLALLDSALPGESLDEHCPTWLAGQAARQGFACDAGDAHALEAHVAARAGSQARARWFMRRDDGRGIAVADGAWYPASAFPRWLLNESWPDPAHALLVSAYHAWMAPILLQLPSLSRNERIELELSCQGRPDMVERTHRLYPQVVDPVPINAARVRARLEGGDTPGDSYEEPFLWHYTFAE